MPCNSSSVTPATLVKPPLALFRVMPPLPCQVTPPLARFRVRPPVALKRTAPRHAPHRQAARPGWVSPTPEPQRASDGGRWGTDVGPTRLPVGLSRQAHPAAGGARASGPPSGRRGLEVGPTRLSRALYEYFYSYLPPLHSLARSLALASPYTFYAFTRPGCCRSALWGCEALMD